MRVIDYFDSAAEVDPDRPLLVTDDYSRTFGEVRRDSEAISRALSTHGLEVGDRVGILAPNVPESLIALLGLWRAGLSWVPLNPRNPLATTVEFMNDVGCSALFLHESFAEQLATVRSGAPALKHVVSLGRGFDGAIAHQDFLRLGMNHPVPEWGDARGDRETEVAAWPTGGTTGRSKAVLWTNEVWTALTEAAFRSWPGMRNAVNLLVAPMTHAAGVMGALFASAGSTVVIRPGFDAEDVLDSIEEHRVTHLFLPPTAFYALLDAQERRPRDCTSLRMLLLSAAPVAPAKLARGVAVFGDCIAQCWGQAEAPFLISHLDSEVVTAAARGRHPERLASCGRSTGACRITVMDEHGRPLPPGSTGELVVRGQLVTPGYLDRPAETADIRMHGWHHTGDIGYLDEAGYVYLMDRKKDMIISGGFNVYPAEVEAALLELPGIERCAVIGVPDEKWGEAVTAIVVRTANSIASEQTVITSLRPALGPVRTPKNVVFTDSLPLTPVGKIDKKALRATFWNRQERMVN